MGSSWTRSSSASTPQERPGRLTNLVAAVIFIIFSHIAWLPALVIAGSSASVVASRRYGRRIPANLLRGVIVIVGVITIVRLV